MAVYDLWFRKVGGRKVPTALNGKGQRWQARWRDSDENQRKRNFTTKDEAERHLAELRVTPQQRSTSATVGERYRVWIAGKQSLRASSISDYEQKWRLNVEPTWGDMPLTEVRHSEVAAWVGQLTARTSPTTARRSYVVLSGVIQQAVRDGVLPADPCTGVRLPRAVKHDVRPLTVPEVFALAEACEPHGLVVRTLAFTGIRFGEMAGLRGIDLDVDRARLRVARSVSEVNGKLVTNTPKTGRTRYVPVPRSLLVDLAALEVEPLAPLLTTQRGGVWRSGSWKRVWAPARERIGRPDLRVHDLRHTAASLAIESGANAKAVQEMMGHQSAEMTLSLYSHLMSDRMDTVADRMDALIKR